MKYLISKRFLFSLLFLILALVGCTESTKNSNEIISDNKMKTDEVTYCFAIFLVKEAQTGDVISSKIEDLQLDTEPVLTDKDILFYNWKEHEIELKQDFDLTKSLDNVPLGGLPFVVIANDKRIYLGAF